MKDNILFISYYTDGYYKEVINKYLVPSLQKFDINWFVGMKPNLHDWLKNGKYKTQFILDMLLFSNKDIVWLDADAELLQFPKLFYDISTDIDIGVHYLDWYKFWHNTENKLKFELLTGTIFFRNNEKTISLVKEWNELNQSSLEWAQKILPKLLDKRKELNVYKLPIEYCQIIKINKVIPKNTVIAQLQVSRETKHNSKI